MSHNGYTTLKNSTLEEKETLASYGSTSLEASDNKKSTLLIPDRALVGGNDFKGGLQMLRMDTGASLDKAYSISLVCT